MSDKTKIRLEYLKRIEKGRAYRIKIAAHLLKIARVLKTTMSELFAFN